MHKGLGEDTSWLNPIYKVMANSMPFLNTMGMALLLCVVGRPVLLSLDSSLAPSVGEIASAILRTGSDFSKGYALEVTASLQLVDIFEKGRFYSL